jgi:two-component system phosphate regulon sensor histidine kinase PhoR
MATQADAAGLTLQTEIPKAAVPVLGDRLALEQAISNLLDNALKYTPEGGSVWLRVRREAGYAIAEVEDTGIGIEPKDRERIFERFYRVDKARSREVGGTGLGLSIVKHVLLSHGGSVQVESEPGRGSIFRIHLPLAH